jgi:hypothetical protein
LPPLFKTAIIAIDQLPETEDTLWLRILGKGVTQDRAIKQVLALPSEHPRRNNILRLLANWRVRIDLGELQDFLQQETIMTLSQAFLDWEQQTQIRSREEGRQGGAGSLANECFTDTTPRPTRRNLRKPITH